MVIWHVLLQGLTLVVAAVVVHYWLGLALYRHHDEQLHDLADQVATRLADAELTAGSAAAAAREGGFESGMTMVIVRTAGGEVLYESPSTNIHGSRIAREPALTQLAANRGASPQYVTVRVADSEPVRFASVPARSGVAHVQVGIEMGDVDSWLHAIEYWAVIVVPLVLFVTGFVSWAAGRGVVPPQVR